MAWAVQVPFFREAVHNHVVADWRPDEVGLSETYCGTYLEAPMVQRIALLELPFSEVINPDTFCHGCSPQFEVEPLR